MITRQHVHPVVPPLCERHDSWMCHHRMALSESEYVDIADAFNRCIDNVKLTASIIEVELLSVLTL